jgi:chromosome segregation ATPase
MSNTVQPDFHKEISKRELKIEHYRQKCAELQEANADLRVELTLVSQERDELQRNLDERTALDATFEAEPLADDTAEVS